MRLNNMTAKLIQVFLVHVKEFGTFLRAKG
jgi:hypothetical protein